MNGDGDDGVLMRVELDSVEFELSFEERAKIAEESLNRWLERAGNMGRMIKEPIAGGW